MTYFLKKKKWLAWVIMLTFLFTSFMPSNIMAGNSVAEAAETSQEQIVKNGQLGFYEDGKVQIQKNIEATNEENQFKITLDVTTEDEITSYVKSSSADVVLVIDKSGSMADSGKIGKTRTAAKKFVDTMLGEQAADSNRVGLVAFADDATSISGLQGKDKKDSLKTEIGKLSANGGTNIQDGLRKANAMLTDPSREQFIIILSDGEPTYSYKGEKAVESYGFFGGYNFRINDFAYDSKLGSGRYYSVSNYTF